MDQGSDQAGKPLSVLKGGKKEPTVAAAGSNSANHGASKKGSRDHSDGDAKVSTLIHNMSHHLIQKVPDLPEFPRKFHVITDEEGECFVLEEGEGGEVARKPTKQVGQAVLKFIKDQGYPFGTQKLTHKHMAEIVHEFLAVAPRIAEPAMVLQKGEKGLTYRKLPFNFESDPGLARSPTFSELMSRTTNARAIMAWIGSLFDPDADMQQYVWMYGAGRNGKGALGRFLGDALGSGARFVRVPKEDNRFWTLQLIGKRLVIYSDSSKAAAFVTDDLFKSMTGGDVVPAEIKGGAMLQVKLKGKHLLFSNKKPKIDAGEADQRRIILGEMAPIKGPVDPFYQQKLWSEGATFLGHCIDLYLDIAGPRREIPCDQTAARELAHENHEFFDSVFHKCFVVDPEAELPAHQFIASIRDLGIKSGPDISRFREFAEKQHGVQRVRNPGAGFTYKGLRKHFAIP